MLAICCSSSSWKKKKKKPQHCHWCLNQNDRFICLLLQDARWLQYIDYNENSHGLWGSSTGTNKAMRNVVSGGCKEWGTLGCYIDKGLFWSLENGCALSCPPACSSTLNIMLTTPRARMPAQRPGCHMPHTPVYFTPAHFHIQSQSFRPLRRGEQDLISAAVSLPVMWCKS